MTDIPFVYSVGMFSVLLMLGALECSNWSSDMMQYYLKYRKSLVSKGKKPVSTTPPSSPSITPAVSSIASVVSQPSIPSVSDDEKIRDYVHSFLSSFFSQLGSVGINPSSFSSPAVVPHLAPPLRGATGGVGADILNRGRLTRPSGIGFCSWGCCC